MKEQQGAALIVVLVLLTVSLMLGLSSVQSSLIDERVAGNYRAITQARHRAEAEAFNLYSQAEDKEAVDNDDLKINPSINWVAFKSIAKSENESCLLQGEIQAACYVRIDDVLYIVAMGTVVDGSGSLVAESEPVFITLGESAENNKTDVLIGCEGVTIANGGKVIGGSIKSIVQEAEIRLTGGTYVEGDMISAGDIYTNGSSGAGGSIFSKGNVTIDAATTYGGSITTTGNVTFGNSAQVKNNVSADGNVSFYNAAYVGSVDSGGSVLFTNSSAYVEGDLNATGGVVNKSGYAGKPIEEFAGGSVTNNPHASNESLVNKMLSSNGKPSSCDPEEIKSTIGNFNIPSNGNITIGNYPLVNGTITPERIQAFDETWNVQADVTLAESSQEEVPGFDGAVPVIRTSDLELTNGELNVAGGNVVLFVDGDLTLGSGGGPGLTIDEGSTLTIYVTGKTNIKSSTQMSQLPVTTNGRPTFSLFSSKEDYSSNDKGIKIDGNAKALASIYAPFSNVSVEAGGGLKGTVRGKTVTVSGGGGIDYQPDQKNGGSGPTSRPSIVKWQ